MRTVFKIAKYNKIDNEFIHVGYDEYNLTYLKSNKSHILRVVVNGYISDIKISILPNGNGYKQTFLKAISDVRNGRNKDKNSFVVKPLKFDNLCNIYHKGIIKQLKLFLCKEYIIESRDLISEYELFDK